MRTRLLAAIMVAVTAGAVFAAPPGMGPLRVGRYADSGLAPEVLRVVR